MAIKFGTFLLMQSPSARSSQEIYSRAIDIAQAAETLGFRNVWLAEHHFSTYGYLSRPAQLATFIAAKTTRLRVGTAVIVVPLHHPLVIAEEIATLDQLAGGRVDIGLGRGYQHYEFERLGLELDSARSRWEESVDIILKAFRGEPFSYEAKPARQLEVGVQRAVYVTDSDVDARAAAEEARWNMRVTLSLRNHYERVEDGRAIPVPAPKEPDVDDLLDRYLVIGTPETCIRQIERLRRDVGITHFNCSFWFGDLQQARVLRSMELFAREVMPAFA